MSGADVIGEGARRRLSIAAADLVAACGGQADVARLAGVSVTSVSNWCNASRPDLMPLAVMAGLEMRCGQPIMTRALAELTGHACAPMADEAGAGADLPVHLARVAASAAQAIGEIATALADGKVCPNEAKSILGRLGDAQGVLTEAGRAIAAHLTPEG